MAVRNNVIWVTGASSGIGRAIVHTLSADKFFVAASSRVESALNAMVDEIPDNKDRISIFPLDIINPVQVEDIYSQIDQTNNVICLVNNAGITSFKSAEENSINEIQKIINTNLLGSIYAIKSVLPDMIKRQSGTIINILTVAAIKTFTNSSAYAASKAGLLAYTNSLREEVRKYNIKVINIFPGATKTPIWSSNVLEKHSERMMSPEDVSNIIRDILNMDGNIVPEEIVLRPVKGDI